MNLPPANTGRVQWPWRDALGLLILIAIGAAIALPRFKHGVNFADEGFLAYGAIEVTEGKIPNRDFVSLQPPLSFCSLAAVFKVLGPSLASERMLGLALYFAIAVLLYFIARIYAPPAHSLFIAIPVLVVGMPLFFFVPFAVWQGMAAVLGAALFYLVAQKSSRIGFAAASGILTALGFALRQDQALYFVIALTIYELTHSIILAPPPRNVSFLFLWWLGAMLTTALIALVFWTATGALGAVIQQLIVFPLTTYAKTSSVPFPHPSGSLPFRYNLFILSFYLPPLVYLGTLIWLAKRSARRQFARTDALPLFLFFWGTLFFLQAVTRSDAQHFVITLPPFLLFAGWLWTRVPSRALFFSGIAIIISFLCLTRASTLPDIAPQNEVLALPRGGVFIAGGNGMTRLVQAIQHRVPADRSILCLPYQPMFYFLSERRNPTRWNYLWPGDQTANDHAELIREAKQDPPALAILSGEEAMALYAPALADYVHRNFAILADDGEVKIYIPR